MNSQPEITKGYYMHYKKKVYRLINFALMDNSPNQEKMVIYQPQYKTSGIPDYILWARPKEMFFENVNMNTARFTFLGRSEEEVKQTLNQYKINITPDFKKTNMLEQKIAKFNFENYAIRGFAIHSETLKSQIIYTKDELKNLYIIPAKDFFEMLNLEPFELSNVDLNKKSIVQYLNQLEKSEEILK